MTVLFIAMVLAVFAGGVSLWLSGLFLGRRVRGPSPAAEAAAATDDGRAERDRLESALSGARARIDEIETQAKVAEAARSNAEGELARAAAELGRVEGEMAQAEGDLKRLKGENEELKTSAEKLRLKKLPPMPAKATVPAVAAAPTEGGNEELDFALAQLDMERVAHQKTRDELEQAKRGATVQLSDGRPSVIPPLPGAAPPTPGRRGAGFQTVSIASRGLPVSSADYDRLRQLNDQLKRDKDDVEAELARAQQELQLLKMRQQQ
jgi:hypothetical protein